MPLTAEQFQAPRGICRYCGCTRGAYCTLAVPGGEKPCHWTDPRMTICSSPSCLEAYRALQADTLRTMIDRKCLCGGVKSRRQMLCVVCWSLLPWALSAELYEPISRGLSCYYAEAAAYLKAYRAKGQI